MQTITSVIDLLAKIPDKYLRCPMYISDGMNIKRFTKISYQENVDGGDRVIVFYGENIELVATRFQGVESSIPNSPEAPPEPAPDAPPKTRNNYAKLELVLYRVGVRTKNRMAAMGITHTSKLLAHSEESLRGMGVSDCMMKRLRTGLKRYNLHLVGEEPAAPVLGGKLPSFYELTEKLGIRSTNRLMRGGIITPSALLEKSSTELLTMGLHLKAVNRLKRNLSRYGLELAIG